MAAQTVALSVNPADELIEFGPLAVRFLLTGDNSTGTVAVFELTVAGGQRLPAPAHSHDHYEETIYGLDGTLTWTVDGKPIDVGPGQALCIPRGAIHRSQFANPGRQSTVRDHAGRDRPPVFPRGVRGAESRSRRAA
jgi:quercetin dioxygenase-like cupin family protein